MGSNINMCGEYNEPVEVDEHTLGYHCRIYDGKVDKLYHHIDKERVNSNWVPLLHEDYNAHQRQTGIILRCMQQSNTSCKYCKFCN